MAENEERVSLAEDLGKAFDEAFPEDPEVESQEEAEEPETPEEAPEEPSDGDEVEEAPEGEEPVEEQPEEQEDAEDEDLELEPLAHWHKEDRETFKGLPKEAQEFLLRRDKEFQASATRKQMEVSDIKKAMDPVRDQLVKNGISEADAIRRLVGAHVQLVENPKNSIMWLMQQYGINISDIVGDAEDASGSHDSAAKREIEELKERLASFEKRTQQEKADTIGRQIQEFAAKNEFFDDVQGEMAMIARSFTSRGEPAPGLEELYEKACWMNDSVREKLMAQKKKAKISQDEEKISRAKRATRATVQPSRKTSGKITDGKKKTLHEDLSDAFDKAIKAR